MIEFSQPIVVWNLVDFCSSSIMNRPVMNIHELRYTIDESPMQGFLEAD